MANETRKQHIVIPEVMADMIETELPHALVFGELVDIDDTLVGVPGDTVTVPKWGLIGEAQDVGELAAIPYENLTTSKTTITIKKVGKGVMFSDEALLSGYGDPLGQGTKQIATAIARKIDTDVLTKMGEATLKYDMKSKPLSYDILADALVKFGERVDVPRIMFITQEQYAELRKDKNFLALKDMAGKPIMMSGVVGEICGVQLRVTANSGIVSGSQVTNYIVEPKAMGLLLKRDTQVETGRDMDKKATKVNADKHYGVFIKDETKILKLLTKKPTIAASES